MAYSTSTPPKLLIVDIAHSGAAIWTLAGTDAAATVDGSGYITNGGDLGMKVNDLVFYTQTGASPPLVTSHTVVTVSSTAPGAVDLSNGTTIGGASNSD